MWLLVERVRVRLTFLAVVFVFFINYSSTFMSNIFGICNHFVSQLKGTEFYHFLFVFFFHRNKSVIHTQKRSFFLCLLLSWNVIPYVSRALMVFFFSDFHSKISFRFLGLKATNFWLPHNVIVIAFLVARHWWNSIECRTIIFIRMPIQRRHDVHLIDRIEFAACKQTEQMRLLKRRKKNTRVP